VSAASTASRWKAENRQPVFKKNKPMHGTRVRDCIGLHKLFADKLSLLAKKIYYEAAASLSTM
jgi:hypothetical protein